MSNPSMKERGRQNAQNANIFLSSMEFNSIDEKWLVLNVMVWTMSLKAI